MKKTSKQKEKVLLLHINAFLVDTSSRNALCSETQGTHTWKCSESGFCWEGLKGEFKRFVSFVSGLGLRQMCPQNTELSHFPYGPFLPKRDF